MPDARRDGCASAPLGELQTKTGYRGAAAALELPRAQDLIRRLLPADFLKAVAAHEPLRRFVDEPKQRFQFLRACELDDVCEEPVPCPLSSVIGTHRKRSGDRAAAVSLESGAPDDQTILLSDQEQRQVFQVAGRQPGLIK